MSFKLLIADEHEVVRAGVKHVALRSGIDVVADVRDGADAVRLTVELAPDVVLADITTPGGGGLTVIDLLRQRRPNLPVVVYSAYDNAALMSRAHAQGAAGYLLKSALLDELIATLRIAASGQSAWTSQQLRRAAWAASKPLRMLDVEAPLTDRELEILGLLTQGMSNERIAKTLGISYETVKEHIQHLLHKIGVTCRTQAAVWVVRNGLA
jgi:DNA-binding NarL/FixJ family response regulator